MSRDCFIAPRPARWSTGLSPLIIMINRWAMGRRRVQRGAGKEWNKRIHRPPSGVSRSHPRLPGPSAGPSAGRVRATKSNFFPFYRPSCRPFPVSPERREKGSPMRCATCHRAVGRPPMQISHRCIVPVRAAPYSATLPPSQSRHKRSRSNFHPVRNFYFSIG